MTGHDIAGADPWEERLRFGQLFLRHLAALSQPLLPSGLQPLDVAGYLEMIRLGEMIAGYDQPEAAKPGFYRDPAYLHGGPGRRGHMGAARRGYRRRRLVGPAPVPRMGRRPAPGAGPQGVRGPRR